MNNTFERQMKHQNRVSEQQLERINELQARNSDLIALLREERENSAYWQRIALMARG